MAHSVPLPRSSSSSANTDKDPKHTSCVSGRTVLTCASCAGNPPRSVFFDPFRFPSLPSHNTLPTTPPSFPPPDRCFLHLGVAYQCGFQEAPIASRAKGEASLRCGAGIVSPGRLGRPGASRDRSRAELGVLGFPKMADFCTSGTRGVRDWELEMGAGSGSGSVLTGVPFVACFYFTYTF